MLLTCFIQTRDASALVGNGDVAAVAAVAGLIRQLEDCSSKGLGKGKDDGRACAMIAIYQLTQRCQGIESGLEKVLKAQVKCFQELQHQWAVLKTTTAGHQDFHDEQGAADNGGGQ